MRLKVTIPKTSALHGWSYNGQHVDVIETNPVYVRCRADDGSQFDLPSDFLTNEAGITLDRSGDLVR